MKRKLVVFLGYIYILEGVIERDRVGNIIVDISGRDCWLLKSWQGVYWKKKKAIKSPAVQSALSRKSIGWLMRQSWTVLLYFCLKAAAQCGEFKNKNAGLMWKPNESIVVEILFWNASGARAPPPPTVGWAELNQEVRWNPKTRLKKKILAFFFFLKRQEKGLHVPVKLMSAQSNICKIKQA